MKILYKIQIERAMSVNQNYHLICTRLVKKIHFIVKKIGAKLNVQKVLKTITSSYIAKSNVISQYFTKSKDYISSCNNFRKKSISPLPINKKSNIDKYMKNIVIKEKTPDATSNTKSFRSKLRMIK